MSTKSIQVTLAEMEAGELCEKLENEIQTAYHRLASFAKVNPRSAVGSKAKLVLTLNYEVTDLAAGGLIMISIVSDIKTQVPKTTKGMTATFAEANEDGVYEPHALAGAGDDENPLQSRLCRRDGRPIE